MAAADIEAVLARHTPELMAISGVSGVGQALCRGTPCIRVYIQHDGIRATLPDTLDGIPVDAVVTGPIRPRTID